MDLLEELIDIYLTNNAPFGAYFDIKEKTIAFDFDPAVTGEPGIDWDDEENDGRYIEIPKITSHEAFHLMEQFAESITDEETSTRLFDTLDIPKPFRRFKDMLFEVGLREEWFEFEHQFAKKEIKEWLKELGD